VTLEWSVIKYVPDLWRNEPRNVGVVVRNEGTAEVKFFAESDTEHGRIDGRTARKLSVDTESYKDWVRYFRRKLSAGLWDEVLEAQRRRPDFPYVIAPGGTLPDTDSASVSEAVRDLFRELVGEPSDSLRSDQEDAETGSDSARGKILRIFRGAHLDVIEGIRVPGVFRGRDKDSDFRQDLDFAFGYMNGRQHLFESVPSRPAAYSFYARAEAAYNADKSINLLAMYPSSKFERGEAELNVIETYGSAIDIDNEETAVQSLVEIVRGAS
jgi:hypothetical protein